MQQNWEARKFKKKRRKREESEAKESNKKSHFNIPVVFIGIDHSSTVGRLRKWMNKVRGWIETGEHGGHTMSIHSHYTLMFFWLQISDVRKILWILTIHHLQHSVTRDTRKQSTKQRVFVLLNQSKMVAALVKTCLLLPFLFFFDINQRLQSGNVYGPCPEEEREIPPPETLTITYHPSMKCISLQELFWGRML